MAEVKRPEQWNYFEFEHIMCDSEEIQKTIIGKYYDDIEILDIENNKSRNVFRKIIGIKLLRREEYIWDGFALLLDDNYWRFGCPLQGYVFLKNKKTKFNCSKIEGIKKW